MGRRVSIKFPWPLCSYGENLHVALIILLFIPHLLSNRGDSILTGGSSSSFLSRHTRLKV